MRSVQGSKTNCLLLAPPGGAEKGLSSVLQHSTAGTSQRSLCLALCQALQAGQRVSGKGATMYQPHCWPGARPHNHTGDPLR